MLHLALALTVLAHATSVLSADAVRRRARRIVELVPRRGVLGRQRAFVLCSAVWENDDLYLGADGADQKTEAWFWDADAVVLRVTRGGNRTNAIRFPISNITKPGHASLPHIFSNHAYHATDAPVASWRALFAGVGYQENCDHQGFHVHGSLWDGVDLSDRFRLGIFTDEQADCSTSESARGIEYATKSAIAVCHNGVGGECAGQYSDVAVRLWIELRGGGAPPRAAPAARRRPSRRCSPPEPAREAWAMWSSVAVVTGACLPLALAANHCWVRPKPAGTFVLLKRATAPLAAACLLLAMMGSAMLASFYDGRVYGRMCFVHDVDSFLLLWGFSWSSARSLSCCSSRRLRPCAGAASARSSRGARARARARRARGARARGGRGTTPGAWTLSVRMLSGDVARVPCNAGETVDFLKRRIAGAQARERAAPAPRI